MKMPSILVGFCILWALCFSYSPLWAQEVQATWMHGDTVLYAQGFYGTQGVAAKRNHPGRRSRAITWTDGQDNLWMYGGAVGYQLGKSGNDLWKWDGANWTWMAGDSTTGSQPNFGAKGVPAASNTPGPISDATSAYRNGRLYLFGGIGVDSDGQVGWLDNLWVWDGSLWTWLSGSAEVRTPGVIGKHGDIGTGTYPGARCKASSVVDERGQFWLYGGFGQYTEASAGHLDDLWIWDGENWIWMNGSGEANKRATYGEKGISDLKNHPGGRNNTHIWFSKEGKLQVFAGDKAFEVGQQSTVFADLWEWDGTSWTWLYGDSTVQFSKHETLYTYDEENRIGHRNGACHWKDVTGDIWIFGGNGQGDSGSGILNDLWRWDGSQWYWMGGGKEPYDRWHYGQKGVFSEENWPKARIDGAYWTDSDGLFWMYGGTNAVQAQGIYGDFWKIDPQLQATLVILGNGVVIKDQDLTPSIADGTDFGLVRLTNVPVRRTYVVSNQGSLPAYLPNTFALELRNSNGGFRVVRQPSKSPLEPGDTLHFTIGFDPSEIKKYECDVVFRSNSKDPEYLFRIQGEGGNLQLIDIEDLQCSSLRLLIDDQAVDHYTVLIADSASTLHYPKNGENYNYSPDYSKAPRLAGNTRIIYQGSDTIIDVEGLVSGRSYQVIVVPGDGLPGNTVYYQDLASILYFKTGRSIWQDSIAISPNVDTGACYTDTLTFSGKSPFALRWADGATDTERILQASASHFFLTTDVKNCLLSSDTVELKLYQTPGIALLYGSKKPWCLGDTVVLSARPSHPSVWSTGDLGDSTFVTESGTYYISSTSEYGCSATDSISVQFGTYPTGRLLQDTFQSVGDELLVAHEADGDSVFFLFNGQFSRDYAQLVVSDTGQLYFMVKNNSGCAVYDQAFVQRRELVLRAFPNAFSPNGDGRNDTWFFIHEADSGQLFIFDRWGEVIHTGSETWDGTVRGEVVPVGEYFYHYTPFDAKKEVRKGSITVVR